MLGELNVHATIPVKDLSISKTFYEQKLGLKPVETTQQTVVYESGICRFLIYQSEFAGTNKGTTASWETGAVPSLAKQLSEKGIVFEHYDLPGTIIEGDVHTMGERQVVWFKDPSGNILCIANGV